MKPARLSDTSQITEKPEWVSWDDIHEVLWQAHSKNREEGVVMRYPSLPGEEIRKRVEGKGKMFVAILSEKLIGTSAVIFKDKSLWCGKGKYAYCCFDSVLPQLQGTGVYRKLCQKREEFVKNEGVSRMLLDTNESNNREKIVVVKAGFKPVDLVWWTDHYNVVFVKWLNGCPLSNFRCKLGFSVRKIMVKTKRFIKTLFKG